MKWPGAGTVRACKSDQEIGVVTHSCLNSETLRKGAGNSHCHVFD